MKKPAYFRLKNVDKYDDFYFYVEEERNESIFGTKSKYYIQETKTDLTIIDSKTAYRLSRWLKNAGDYLKEKNK